MWQTFKEIWVFCRTPLTAAGLGALITILSIALGGLSLASLPAEPTTLTPEHIRTLEVAFGAIVLAQLVFMSILILWFFRGRMTIPRAIIIISPLAVLYLFRWQLAEYLDVLLFLTSWFTIWSILFLRRSRHEPTSPLIAVPTRSGKFIQRHVLDGEYELRFDGVDENGFGHATNPKTNLRYLLNKDTKDYDPKELKEGQYFGARITRAHYVVEITQVIPYVPES